MSLTLGLLALTCAAPPTGGLVLWLDAADSATIERGDDGRVTRWRDKSPAGNEALPRGEQGPLLIDDAMAGRPALRFAGSDSLRTSKPLADGHGQLTMFIVWQRSSEQVNDKAWQRLISSLDPSVQADNKPPSLLLDTGRESIATPPAMAMELLSQVWRGRTTIGASDVHGGSGLYGDLAEVLVYDHAFLAFDPIQNVKDYLIAKWGIVEDTTSDWTLVGPLPDRPQRISDELPLSDQQNSGGWRKWSPMWDEFEGERLDADKWWDHNPNWYGRQPSRYVAENVTVKDGRLGITMSIGETLPPAKLYPQGDEYHKYAAASIVSKTPVVYGYFEIRAKAMPSAASSAWWFSGGSANAEGGQYRSEIDVFEIGGRAPGFEGKLNMNLHVFQTPQEKRHWSRGGRWQAPFEFAADFHTFGLEWAPDQIKYYLDGVLVRNVANTDWHNPLQMLFDTETMPNWMGMPQDEDLPSTFEVEYVRAWKNDATDIDWTKLYTYRGDPGAETTITEYVRSLSKR